jgi:putative transport protein
MPSFSFVSEFLSGGNVGMSAHITIGMKSVLLLGALAGSLTMTAAMGAVQQRSQSPVAVLGYTQAYPIANILLTLWGTVIVILTAH